MNVEKIADMVLSDTKTIEYVRKKAKKYIDTIFDELDTDYLLKQTVEGIKTLIEDELEEIYREDTMKDVIINKVLENIEITVNLKIKEETNEKV